MDIEERKNKIHDLERALKQESVRIVRAQERKLSDEYTETDKKLKQEKAEYEQIVGRPYTPPEPKLSQMDSTLFIRPRTRTASFELPSESPEEKSEAKLS